jgi:hypothetical protein
VYNTLVTRQPEDFFLFSHSSATTDLLLYNNLFAGPGRGAMQWFGNGHIAGEGNFFAFGMDVPAALNNGIVGDGPGFVNPAADDFHLRPDSPCRNAGVSDARWRDEADRLVRGLPTHEPRRRQPGATERRVVGKPDIGAFESVR